MITPSPFVIGIGWIAIDVPQSGFERRDGLFLHGLALHAFVKFPRHRGCGNTTRLCPSPSPRPSSATACCRVRRCRRALMPSCDRPHSRGTRRWCARSTGTDGFARIGASLSHCALSCLCRYGRMTRICCSSLCCAMLPHGYVRSRGRLFPSKRLPEQMPALFSSRLTKPRR